jgi:hypothetical protein
MVLNSTFPGNFGYTSTMPAACTCTNHAACTCTHRLYHTGANLLLPQRLHTLHVSALDAPPPSAGPGRGPEDPIPSSCCLLCSCLICVSRCLATAACGAALPLPQQDGMRPATLTPSTSTAWSPGRCHTDPAHAQLHSKHACCNSTLVAPRTLCTHLLLYPQPAGQPPPLP